MEDAAKLALDRWPQILEDAGIDRKFLRNIHGPCPVCGGADRFRFDDKGGKGTFFCSHCGAGDGFKLLQLYRNCSFKDAAKFVRDVLHCYPVERIAPRIFAEPQKQQQQTEETRKKLQQTWDRASPVKKGDPVWKYLVLTRKLPEVIPAAIRYLPRAPYYVEEEGKPKLIGKFPMMLTKVLGADGHPVGLHRTYLTEGGEKAPVDKAKKLMRGLGITGGAIRLFPAGEVLAVAEGIETALAVHALTGQASWATVSATLMVKLIVPANVKTVFIYADNDSVDQTGKRAGQDAARNLAERLRSEGKEVRIVYPLGKDTDICDVWVGKVETQQKKLAQKANRKAA